MEIISLCNAVLSARKYHFWCVALLITAINNWGEICLGRNGFPRQVVHLHSKVFDVTLSRNQRILGLHQVHKLSLSLFHVPTRLGLDIIQLGPIVKVGLAHDLWASVLHLPATLHSTLDDSLLRFLSEVLARCQVPSAIPHVISLAVTHEILCLVEDVMLGRGESRKVMLASNHHLSWLWNATICRGEARTERDLLHRRRLPRPPPLTLYLRWSVVRPLPTLLTQTTDGLVDSLLLHLLPRWMFAPWLAPISLARSCGNWR